VTTQEWIEKRRLVPHPEGGYYRETYRSPECISGQDLPARYSGARCLATSIYFLLPGTQHSRWHRLKSDEIWHFHDGSPITIHGLNPGGDYWKVQLGVEEFQAVMPAGCWFAAVVDDRRSYALVGCTLAPGFEFQDFELADPEKLAEAYPQYKDIILALS